MGSEMCIRDSSLSCPISWLCSPSCLRLVASARRGTENWSCWSAPWMASSAHTFMKKERETNGTGSNNLFQARKVSPCHMRKPSLLSRNLKHGIFLPHLWYLSRLFLVKPALSVPQPPLRYPCVQTPGVAFALSRISIYHTSPGRCQPPD